MNIFQRHKQAQQQQAQDFSSTFAGRSWYPEVLRVGQDSGWHTVGGLDNQGYWANKYSDWDDAARLAIGPIIAQDQARREGGNLFGIKVSQDFEDTVGQLGAMAGGALMAAGLGQAVGGFAAGTAEGTTGAAEASASAGASSGSTGGSMWDWLDSFDSFSTDPSLADLGGDTSFWSNNSPWGTDSSWLNEVDPAMGGNSAWGTDSSWLDVVDPAPGTGLPGAAKYAPGLGLTSWWNSALNAGKSLLGDASGGATSAGRGLLDGILNDPLGAAFNSTPFLLALMEANRQGQDIDGVLNRINGGAYARSVMNPYDMDTARGRTDMEQDQLLRGVRGSSFGNNDLNNYDYMRSMGRGDLFNRANLAEAGLQGNLLNQRNTNRNLLLGAGLNASARLFSPPSDPFGLSRLGIR